MNSRVQASIAIARGASVLVLLASIAVITGWLRNIPELTSLYQSGPTIKTNTAVALACCATANLLLISTRHRMLRWLALILAIVPLTIGALTLSEHIVGWELGIDQVIAKEAPGAVATTSPNRMGPPAALASLLLGLSLLLSESSVRRRRSLGHLLAILTSVIALLPVMGYAYGFSQLYASARFTGIALATAATLLLMSVAVQAGRPDVGLASFMCRGDEVGVFGRRLLPAAILAPFGIGWLLARMLLGGYIDAAFAISAMAVVLIILLVGVIWRTGMQLVSSLDARAATERALAESERTLRETDQQKTEFLATLSHELRNPLAPIRFAVELLNGPPSSAARARQTIERQVRHLTRLIDDLLDLTRINRNKLQLHVRPSELRQLIEDAVDGVSTEVRVAGHQLEMQLPDEEVWLNVDPDRVIQMLVNLLTNAVRYSESDGKIFITTSLTWTDVTISVRDTGHGIDPVDLDRVFERFVQVGKVRHGGLGIGLALVKALAELHGGSVEAFSEGIGRGSDFRIRLPRTSAPVKESPVPAIASTERYRVLVVDDNRDAADMLGNLLAGAGHDVTITYDGADALRLAMEHRPEVGLLDIGMPGMDGYELASKLRKRFKRADLFLVAITGWGQEDDRRRALAAGFDAHLTKPADLETISALLADRVQSRAPVPLASDSASRATGS